MFGGRFSLFSDTPPVVKNFIYLNIIMFLTTLFLGSQFHINLSSILGIHYYQSELFKPYQIITHMFMHASIPHIFFNMFGLWMFGRILEGVWGSKRFFIYYFITGIGAITLNMVVQHFELIQLSNFAKDYINHPGVVPFENFVEKYGLVADNGGFINRFLNIFSSQQPDALSDFINKFRDHPENQYYIDQSVLFVREYFTDAFNGPTIGASGAIYGVLLAFGMLFPNTELMFLFIPVPIKAKWVVIIFAAMEFFTGLSQPGSNVAHFAHLGGMLFGFILIKYWNSKRTNFY